MSINKITFIGIGLMGLPMAQNLLKSGYALTAWNRTIEKAAPLGSSGAQVVTNVAESVESADVVITSLTDGKALHDVLADPGLRQNLTKGAVWIDTSSTRPEEAKAAQVSLSGLGVRFVDAPVSGGTRGAEQGTLAIMAGAQKNDFKQIEPVLSCMGRAVHVGPVGAGQLAKLANQLIVACTIGAVAEATLLLEKGGADSAAVREALKGGFADSIILQQHGQRMSQRDFNPGGLSQIQLKDLENILQQAGNSNLKLPMAQHMRERYKRYVMDLNGGEKDHSGIFEELLDINT